jgi:hypothetical protein
MACNGFGRSGLVLNTVAKNDPAAVAGRRMLKPRVLWLRVVQPPCAFSDTRYSIKEVNSCTVSGPARPGGIIDWGR